MKSTSLRARLAVLSAAILGIVLLTFGWAAWLLIRQQKLESIDTEIRSLGARHPGWIANRGNYARLDDALAFIFGESHRDQIVLMVLGGGGDVLYRSKGWPPELDLSRLDWSLADNPEVGIQRTAALQETSGEAVHGWGGAGRGFGPRGGPNAALFTKIPKFQTVDLDRTSWRLGMLGTADTTLIIGLSYEATRMELDRLRKAFAMILPVPLFLVGLGGWIVAGRAIRPLKSIADTAERVTAEGLDQRIPAAGEDKEIARVIRVLNLMMDRLEASFHQATRFSADASHELKTPIAIMQGELENALQSAEQGSPEQRFIGDLLEQTQRLNTITRGLLLFAQADAGRLKLAKEEVDLSEEIEALLEDARVLSMEKGLRFDTHVQPGLAARTDRALIRAAILNLLSNSVKYSEPNGSIGVHAARLNDTILLTISNSGPGIPPADQPRVFERFFRGTTTRGTGSEGIGIGLSLAREIVRAHGGALLLKESRPGYTAFTLSIPTLGS